MTTYSQGQVVLIPFPFTDLTTTKQRPAVILSSQVPARLNPDEYRLSGEDQRTAGLPKPSLIKLGKIVTIDQRLVRRMLDTLPPETLRQVREVLLQNF